MGRLHTYARFNETDDGADPDDELDVEMDSINAIRERYCQELHSAWDEDMRHNGLPVPERTCESQCDVARQFGVAHGVSLALQIHGYSQRDINRIITEEMGKRA